MDLSPIDDDMPILCVSPSFFKPAEDVNTLTKLTLRDAVDGDKHDPPAVPAADHSTTQQNSLAEFFSCIPFFRFIINIFRPKPHVKRYIQQYNLDSEDYSRIDDMFIELDRNSATSPSFNLAAKITANGDKYDIHFQLIPQPCDCRRFTQIILVAKFLEPDTGKVIRVEKYDPRDPKRIRPVAVTHGSDSSWEANVSASPGSYLSGGLQKHAGRNTSGVYEHYSRLQGAQWHGGIRWTWDENNFSHEGLVDPQEIKAVVALNGDVGVRVCFRLFCRIETGFWPRKSRHPNDDGFITVELKPARSSTMGGT